MFRNCTSINREYGTCIGRIAGGRPKASAVVKLFSFLIDESNKVEVDLQANVIQFRFQQGQKAQEIALHPVGEVAVLQGDEIEVPLIEVVHARSGDKGKL